MKIGGLFSGVGGFELAWTQLGHEVAWMCEIDKNARKVLHERFPGVPVYEDVEQLDPAEVEAVDVLTGGSPCQGFSIAGQRTGMKHPESQLFADYVRIMDGLAERGLKYAIWENVPGVLSIRNPDGERTFTHVVGALAGGSAAVRLDPKRKWNVGLVANGERAVSWRVLDSRYFGVAQRRRRVFACVAFGDTAADRAGRALLAVSEGVRGYSPSSWPEGQGVTGGVASRAGIPSVAGTLGGKSSGGIDDLDRMTYVPDVAAGVEEASAFNWQSGGDARGLDLRDEPSALSSSQTPAVLIGPQAFRKSRRAQSSTDDETWVADGGANTLNVFDVGDTRTTHAIVEPEEYGVRRLTPVECERLQSFPDGWTEPAGSDSARYKAMGNAVTVNVVRWIMGRMVAA